MNIEPPHDIINIADLLKLSLPKRKKYVQLDAASAKQLGPANEAERAEWLDKHSKDRSVFDEMRIARAKAKRERKQAAKVNDEYRH